MRYIALAVAAVLTAIVLVFALTRGNSQVAEVLPPSSPASVEQSDVSQPPAQTSVVASPSAGSGSPASVRVASPSPSASPAATSAAPNPAHAECTAVSEGFVPNRYVIERVGADARVVSLGLDGEGNIAAPPKNQPATASWWNQGPLPGSDKGKAVFSIHTYRNGGAVGNDLYRGGAPQLQKGDLVKVYGSEGQVLCYEFTEAKKVWVKDYDPDSDVMVDYDGKPQMVIIVCWDFDRATENWDSRIFFYGTPVTT